MRSARTGPASREKLCEPSLECSGQCAEQNAVAGNHTGPECPCVEEQAMVPNTAGIDGRFPNTRPGT